MPAELFDEWQEQSLSVLFGRQQMMTNTKSIGSDCNGKTQDQSVPSLHNNISILRSFVTMP